jgi:hypothetical protein
MVISSKEFFDNRLIRSHTNHIHPSRSFDLKPLDYFLFLTLKNTRKSYQSLQRCERRRRATLCINVEGQRFQRSL